MTTMPFPGEDGLRVSIGAPDSLDVVHALRPNGGPFLHAIITNVSGRPLKVWPEHSRPGYANLTLEILALHGETLLDPVIVSRRGLMWPRGGLRPVSLEPGEAVVRAVHLHRYEPGQRSSEPFWADNIRYLDFPVLAGSKGYETRLRAVFTGSASERGSPAGLWVGRAVSKAYDFKVWGAYR